MQRKTSTKVATESSLGVCAEDEDDVHTSCMNLQLTTNNKVVPMGGSSGTSTRYGMEMNRFSLRFNDARLEQVSQN